MALAERERADEERHQRDSRDPIETRVFVTRLRGEERGDEWQRATKPAVADVIRQRERGVADPRWESLDQERGDRPIDDRDVDDLNADEQSEHDHRRAVLHRASAHTPRT